MLKPPFARLSLALLAVGVLAAPAAARGDVTYSYTSIGAASGTTFTLVSPDFLTYSQTYIPVTTGGQLEYLAIDLGTITGAAFYSDQEFGAATSLGFETSIFSGTYNIGQDGTYNDGQGDTLVISGSPAGSLAATPEPNSLALLGTGLIGFVGVAKRRIRQMGEWPAKPPAPASFPRNRKRSFTRHQSASF